MKKILVALLVIVLFGACRFRTGSGVIITEKKTFSGFTGISASNGFEIELTSGGAGEVVLEADDNLMKYVVTEVSNGVLKIGIKNNISVSNAHLKAFVTAPGIHKIVTSSAATVDVKNGLQSNDKIVFQASSGSEINATVDAPDVVSEASSGSTLNLKGRTKDLSTRASSGGTIDALGLLSESTEASSSSGGTIKVHASVSITADASSGSNIVYKGGAASVTKKESSGGSVEKMD